MSASHERGAPAPPAAPPAQVPAGPSPQADADISALPSLPRRQRDAEMVEGPDLTGVDEEVMDLFGDIDDTGGRSSLGDFQRGQESARREARG